MGEGEVDELLGGDDDDEEGSGLVGSWASSGRGPEMMTPSFGTRPSLYFRFTKMG